MEHLYRALDNYSISSYIFVPFLVLKLQETNFPSQVCTRHVIAHYQLQTMDMEPIVLNWAIVRLDSAVRPLLASDTNLLGQAVWFIIPNKFQWVLCQ